MGLSLGWRTSRSFRVQKKSQSHAHIFFFLGLILIFSYFRLYMGVPGDRLCTTYKRNSKRQQGRAQYLSDLGKLETLSFQEHVNLTVGRNRISFKNPWQT